MITSDDIRTFCRVLNTFENDSGSPDTDYATVYIYGDGNNGRRQVTLARGFTDDGGNLKKVVERYIAKSGARSEFFKARLSKFAKGVLVKDAAFIQALRDSSDEPAMRAAQDEIFEEVYLDPALVWADKHGFREVLSVGAIVDSFLHSGKILDWLRAKFAEAVPSEGGTEKTWTKEYLTQRLAWFKRAKGALHNATYRPLFFLGEIAENNWALHAPLIANGRRI